MFNLQGSELIIILLLALVVLGPEKLPEAMRKAGQAYAELKKMSSGFQSEFRAAVEEPMREIRETANVLRDSADFTKLQSGGREEKPKSAEMAAADPDAVPVDSTPTFESPTDGATGPEPSADSEAAPFDDASPEDPPLAAGAGEVPKSAPITSSAPFSGMSSTQPRQTESPSAAGTPAEPPAPEAEGPTSGPSPSSHDRDTDKGPGGGADDSRDAEPDAER